MHGYNVERRATYDIDRRRIGHIHVATLLQDARPVARGADLIGIRALDGRVVFVFRADVIITDPPKQG